MKIALLTDGIYPYVIGGMQKHSFYLAKYFAMNSVYVDIYHTSDNLKEAESLSVFSSEEKKFIQSFVFPFPKRTKFPGHYLRSSYDYSRLIYDKLVTIKDYDFIYVQGLCGMYLFEKKESVHVPVGLNFHGLEMFQIAPGLRQKLEQLLFRKPVLRSLRKADVVFSLGGKLTDILIGEGIDKKSISQISIGIDESWIRTHELTKNDCLRFVFVGRYERRKGIEELSQVLQSIKNENFRFDFIGSVPADKKIVSENIQYHGNIPDPLRIKEILQESDVLVCPSYSEGMPTVILEAMASGLAIIASNVGAVNEQVNPSNGVTIRAGNVEDLKSAMLKFLVMPETELNEMKRSSIQRIKNGFLWNGIMKLTLEEIKSKLKGSSAG